MLSAGAATVTPHTIAAMQVPTNFPATMDGLMHLPADDLNALFGFHTLNVSGDLQAKRQFFLAFIQL